MRNLILCLVLILGFTVGIAIQAADAIDPSPQPASVQGEIGPRVEPNGRCTAATGGEIGPCVEPDGRQRA